MQLFTCLSICRRLSSTIHISFLYTVPTLLPKLFMEAACHVRACFEREASTKSFDFAFYSNVAVVAWFSRGNRYDFESAIGVSKSMRVSRDDIDRIERIP